MYLVAHAATKHPEPLRRPPSEVVRGALTANPRIQIELKVGNRRETITALEQFQLDIVIMGRPPDNMETYSQAFGDHPHVFIAPPGHRLCGRRRIELGMIKEEKLLLREAGSGTRTLMEWFYARKEITPRIAMQLDSNETIKQAVMAGLGIAFISAHAVAAELEVGRLCVLPVAGMPIIRKWHVVRARDKHLPSAGQALWHFLDTDGAKFLPNVSNQLRAIGDPV